jgi:hypothetical protein
VVIMSPRRVFISVRLSEDGDHAAAQLKDALEPVGISAFVCDPLVGDNLAEDIACAVDACELFVVLGTRGYGVQGDTRFSSRDELEFAVGRKKPIFLIKRCDDFADPLTQMYLPASMFHQVWPPAARLPDGLVDDIVAKLATIPPSAPPDPQRT